MVRKRIFAKPNLVVIETSQETNFSGTLTDNDLFSQERFRA